MAGNTQRESVDTQRPFHADAKAASLPLKIDCLQSAEAFEQLKDVWQILERRDPQCMPSNTWSWAKLWWTHYSSSHDTLALLIARQGGEVVAIAPLYIDQGLMCRIVPVCVLRFIGSGRDTSPDYLNIIALPAAREAAEKAFLLHLHQLSGWHKLYLSDMREDSTLVKSARAYVDKQSGCRMPDWRNRLMRANLPASWEEYRAKLNRKRRKQINHRRNRLDAAGVAELNICSTREELAEASDALIELHRLRWQSKGEQGAFVTDSYEQFHRAVINAFFACDALWLLTLKLDDKIIGVQYVFLWRGELQFFQSGYSPEHEDLSPGHVLFTYAIQRAIEQGLTGIDMLKGRYQYKSVYAKDHLITCSVGFVKPGIRSLLGQLAKVVWSARNTFKTNC